MKVMFGNWFCCGGLLLLSFLFALHSFFALSFQFFFFFVFFSLAQLKYSVARARYRWDWLGTWDGTRGGETWDFLSFFFFLFIYFFNCWWWPWTSSADAPAVP
jgi:hypothetical protein